MIPISLGLYEYLRKKQVANLHEKTAKESFSPLTMFKMGMAELRHRTSFIETGPADMVARIPLESLTSTQQRILASRQEVVEKLNQDQIIYLLKTPGIDKNIIFSFLHDRLGTILIALITAADRGTQITVQALTTSQLLQGIPHLIKSADKNSLLSLLSEKQFIELLSHPDGHGRQIVSNYIHTVDLQALALKMTQIVDKIDRHNFLSEPFPNMSPLSRKAFFISILWGQLIPERRDELYSHPTVLALLGNIVLAAPRSPKNFMLFFKDERFRCRLLNALYEQKKLEKFLQTMENNNEACLLIFQSLPPAYMQSIEKYRLKKLINACSSFLHFSQPHHLLALTLDSIKKAFKFIPFPVLQSVLYLRYNLERPGDGYVFDPFTFLFLSKEQLQQLKFSELYIYDNLLDWLDRLAEILSCHTQYRQSLMDLSPEQLKYLYESAQSIYKGRLPLVNRNPYLAPYMKQPQYFSDLLEECDEEIIEKTLAFQTKYGDVDGLCTSLIGADNFKKLKKQLIFSS